MERVVSLALVATVLAAPAWGQVTPGGPLEVVEADGTLVGTLVGGDGLSFLVSLDGPNGPLVLRYDFDLTSFWETERTIEWDGFGCNGTPYITRSQDFGFGWTGRVTPFVYAVDSPTDLYGASAVTSEVSFTSRSFRSPSGTCNVTAATPAEGIPATFIDSLPAGPLFIEVAPAPTPAVPLLGLGALALALAVSAVALIRR